MSLIGGTPGVVTKRMVYRGYQIKITREGSWVEANIYRKSGHLDEHLGSGSYGPGVYEGFFRRGKAVIDAMHGD